MPSFRRHSRKAQILICTACTVLALGLYMFQYPIFHFPLMGRMELTTQDALLRSYGKPAKLDPQIVFLAIDGPSIQLDRFGSDEIEASPALKLMKQGWPYSRAVYPLVIDRLIKAGAKVVALDLMFPTPREGDDEFRAALDKYHGQVVIGYNFVGELRGEQGGLTAQYPASLVPTKAPPDDRIGFVNFWPDGDGVVRRAYYGRTAADLMGEGAGDYVCDSLASEVLRKSGHADKIKPGIPLRMRFAGPPGTFVAHSLCDIFDKDIWNAPPYNGGSFFRDKIVVIGPDGNFLKDQVQTPYKEQEMPGPELHMNAINSALSSAWLYEAPGVVNLLLIAGAGALSFMFCVFCPAPMLRLALLILACIAWLVAAQLLYNYFSLFIFVFTPLAALGSSGVICLSWDFFQEQREKARVRGTLERYVSRQAVKEIIDNPETFFHTLGGVRKAVAVMFTDLRNFTSMTEESDGHEIITQLNEYFDVMVEPILANNGCLDKLIGDAIMAVWGNIQSRGPTQDVRDAIISAVKMRDSLPKLNEQWIAAGKKPLAMGIGVNYGEVIVGNLGSKQQMNFTVIGDTVNLGSRIEGTTKEYGVDLLVGEDAANLVKDFFLMQTAGLTQVKGRKKPVELFYIIGERPAVIEPRQEEYMRIYGEGMALYIKGDFAAAGEKFKRSLELHPPDALARVYIERCEIMAKDPVPEGWNGVFVMKGK